MTETGTALPREINEAIDEIAGAHRLRLGTPSGDAWGAFLRAHASLMRVLDAELLQATDLSLSDFDVLIQLGLSDCTRLRMSELADRTLISRSGMTRRAGQLEERGLVARQPHAVDRRSVEIALTDEGWALLRRALPVHADGIGRHFLDNLTDDELTQLRTVMEKVTADCDFG